MPTYADRIDLNTFFSQASITDWADKDRDGELSESELAAIDSAIQAAQAIVDSHLAKAGYAAPFDATAFAALPQPLQSLMRQWTVTLAGFNIYAWRGLRDKTNAMQAAHNTVMQQLRAITEGLSLAGIERAATVESGVAETLDHIRGDGWDW